MYTVGMIGDRIVPKPYQTTAARDLFAILQGIVKERDVIAVSGESGSGKTEIAFELSRLFDDHAMPAMIFQQDDYFLRPPRTNEKARRRNLKLVGLDEVNLKRLDNDLARFKRKPGEILHKPLVVFYEDRITREAIEPSAFKVAIAEGTYATLLSHVDVRVFIERNYKDTADDRQQRGRETNDEFLDQVLEIEHGIISKHRTMADIVIAKDFMVTIVNPEMGKEKDNGKN